MNKQIAVGSKVYAQRVMLGRFVYDTAVVVSITKGGILVRFDAGTELIAHPSFVKPR
jgi:hypothetical protein